MLHGMQSTQSKARQLSALVEKMFNEPERSISLTWKADLAFCWSIYLNSQHRFFSSWDNFMKNMYRFFCFVINEINSITAHENGECLEKFWTIVSEEMQKDFPTPKLKVLKNISFPAIIRTFLVHFAVHRRKDKL